MSLISIIKCCFFALAVIAVFCIISCSDNPSESSIKLALQNASFTYHTPDNPKMAERAAYLLPRIIIACPGLNQYAADFTVADVGKSYMHGYNEGLALKFAVSDNPRMLPDSIRLLSKGHACSIDIKADGTKMYIGKSACHSICYGNLGNNDRGLMGREFLLAK